MLIFSSDVPEMQDMICLERLGVLVDLRYTVASQELIKQLESKLGGELQRLYPVGNDKATMTCPTGSGVMTSRGIFLCL